MLISMRRQGGESDVESFNSGVCVVGGQKYCTEAESPKMRHPDRGFEADGRDQQGEQSFSSLTARAKSKRLWVIVHMCK